MKKIYKYFILTLATIVCGVFFVTNLSWAMPIGTLLYRTSSGEKMYGYSTNTIFEMDGVNPKINCGHVGIYAGQDENDEHMVLEAVSSGIKLIPSKYFVNLGRKEKFIGAKIPKNFNRDTKDKVQKIINFLSKQNLAYDFDSKHQKGPLSGQWTCVGLTEKIYESLGFDKEFINLNQLEYSPSNYEIDITSDGFDNTSAYNESEDDYFSEELEFSKIGRREKFLEVVGYNFGKVIDEDRYFFFPYTQFLQQNLEDISVDIPLESSFLTGEIRGVPPKGKIVAKAFINNTESSIKIAGDRTKKLAIKIKDIFTNGWHKLVKKDVDPGNVLPAEEKKEKTFPKITLKDLTPNPTIASEEEVPTEDNDSTKEEKIILELPKKILEEPKLGIEYVIDGDTFVLTTGEKVRYIDIDAPELGRNGQEDDECLAWVARLRNMELLGGGELKLVKDENVDKDVYGRLLRYVYIGDVFINKELAREGLARTFFCQEDWKNCPVIENKEKQNIILQASKLAQTGKLGLFSGICDEKEEKKIAKKEEIEPIKKVDEEKKKKEKEDKPSGNVSKLPLFHTGGSSGDKNSKKEDDGGSDNGTNPIDPPEEKPIINIVISEFVTRNPNGAADEFIELYNPNDEDIDLFEWRLQYRSATGDSWRNKTGKKGLPEIIIPAKGFLLLASKGYSGSVASDYQHSANWGLADKGGHIRIIDTNERKIDKVGYGNAIGPEGEAIQAKLSDSVSLERKALVTSTAETMTQNGIHWTLGNAYDSGNNKNDFIIKENPEPQNSSSLREPRGSISPPLKIPGIITNLSFLTDSVATSSISLIWSAPNFANLNEGSFYELKYIEKEGDCNLNQNWEKAISISASMLPIPATEEGKEQTVKATSLLPDTEYCFAIKTYNGQNWSLISNQISGRTLEELPEEKFYNIQAGYTSFSGGKMLGSLNWEHILEEGENRILVVSIFMYFKRGVEKVTFADMEMTKASETDQKSNGITSAVYYLKNPPTGAQEVFAKTDGKTMLFGAALGFFNCNLKDPIAITAVKLSNQKEFYIDIQSPSDNTLAVETLTLDRVSGIEIIPLSEQTMTLKRIIKHPYYGYTAAMGYKELEKGINRLKWWKSGPNNITQNIIILKPKNISE